MTDVSLLPAVYHEFFFSKQNWLFYAVVGFFQLGVCWNHIIRRNTIDKFALENCDFKVKRIRFLFFGKRTNGKKYGNFAP